MRCQGGGIAVGAGAQHLGLQNVPKFTDACFLGEMCTAKPGNGTASAVTNIHSAANYVVTAITWYAQFGAARSFCSDDGLVPRQARCVDKHSSDPEALKYPGK